MVSENAMAKPQCFVCSSFRVPHCILSSKNESNFVSSNDQGHWRPICPLSAKRGVIGCSRSKISPMRPMPVRMGALSPSSGPAIEEGYVVEYVATGGHRRLGTIARPDGKKNWIVVDTNGLPRSIAPRQISYVVGCYSKPKSGSQGDTKEADTDPISTLQEECENRMQEISELLEVAWEIVESRGESEGGRTTTLKELVEIMLDGISTENLYAAHAVLCNDRFYFKEKVIKGQTFYEARTVKQVAESKVACKAEERKAEVKRAMEDAVLASYESRDVSILQSVVDRDEFDRIVSALQVIAEDCGSDVREFNYVDNIKGGFASLDDRHQKSARVIFSMLGKSISPFSAFDVLMNWGICNKHENMFLRYSGLLNSMTFSSDLQLDADERTPSAVIDRDAGLRHDLTHVRCFAVDSADTSEIDDAIGWDYEKNCLWVHVADPLRYFPDGLQSNLCAEALKRASTLYLPTAKLTMFPSNFASSRLSLGGSEGENVALSFGFAVLEDGRVDQSTVCVCPSYISKPERVTYEQVDQVLSTESHEDFDVINHLYDVAKRRQECRIASGAIVVPSPFPKLTVEEAESEEPVIRVEILQTNTRSWTLVSELMITACAIAGDLGKKASLSMPYRCQQEFDRPSMDAISELREGAAQASFAFKSAAPSEIRPNPAMHSSLGLEAYVQVTSPIRRGTDLIAHAQIKAHLRGEDPPLDKDAMSSEISRHTEKVKSLKSVDQRTTRYWYFEYLRRQGTNAVHEGVYVKSIKDNDPPVGLISLNESAFQVVARVPRDIKLGTPVRVKVSSVDPRRMSITADATIATDFEAEAEATKRWEKELDDVLSEVSLGEEVS